MALAGKTVKCIARTARRRRRCRFLVQLADIDAKYDNDPESALLGASTAGKDATYHGS